MVPVASDGISRAPPYSGNPPGDRPFSPTGLLPSVAGLSSPLRLKICFVTPWRLRNNAGWLLQHPWSNTCGLSHPTGLGCSRFARRYYGNRGCFLFLGLLRCFSSPTYLPCPMCSSKDDTALPVPGFPIRKSPDLRLFGDYPELFAACHVLPRLLPPRHPPHALTILVVKTFATLCSFQGASESRHKPVSRQAYARRSILLTLHHNAAGQHYCARHQGYENPVRDSQPALMYENP